MNGKTRHVCQKNVKKQGLTHLAAILSNIELHYDGNTIWLKIGVIQFLKEDNILCPTWMFPQGQCYTVLVVLPRPCGWFPSDVSRANVNSSSVHHRLHSLLWYLECHLYTPITKWKPIATMVRVTVTLTICKSFTIQILQVLSRHLQYEPM